jgi:beta-lactamase regulating signal transducer with metallopeptidase domain
MIRRTEVTDVLLAYVINAVWQIPLALAGALALTRVARPPAAWRSRLLSALLFLTVLLPALPFLETISVSASTPLPRPLNSAATASALATVNPPPMPSGAPFTFSQWQASLILAGLAVIISIACVRLIFAATMTRIWLRQSRDVVLPNDAMLHLERFAERFGIAAPAVRLSPSLSAPAVVGIFGHSILIPEPLVALEPEALRAVLLHECAHVARRDYASNWICELLSLPVCWHPLLFVLKRELRLARELACDRMAATAMPSPIHYATRLVQVARSGLQQRNHTLQIAPGLIGDGELERRIEAIVDPRTISRLRRMGEALATGVLFAGLGTLVMLLRITPAIAQDDPFPSARSLALTVAATTDSSLGSRDGGSATVVMRVPVSRPASAHLTSFGSFTGGAPSSPQSATNSLPRTIGRSGTTVERGPDGKLRVRSSTPAEIAYLDSAAAQLKAIRPVLDRARAAILSETQADQSSLSRARIGGSREPMRHWRIVPAAMPVIVHGDEALKVLPDGTVLFSEGRHG